MSSTSSLIAGTSALAAIVLAGCVQAPGHMQPDYGNAVRQNVIAQVADPAPRYARKLPPGSNGQRADMAQRRYQSGDSVQPAFAGTGAIGGGDIGSGAPATGGNGNK